ncbi:MAG TPA: metallophosphoesterase [Phycisphaerae bacterium]|nr:metallophosphoesterase [Phycisphaerae bacterium]
MRPVTVHHVSAAVEGWPRQADGLRIAHLTDLHLRSWNKVVGDAQRLMVGLEYDLVALTGDLGCSPDDWLRTADLLRRFLAPIYAPYGTFAVLGNHDAPILGDHPGLDVTFLRDECVTVRHNGVLVPVVGIEQTEDHHGDPRSVLSGVIGRTPAIMLAHYPSTVNELPHGRVGLVLAGHTHGGQIRLPLVGCVWTHDRISTRYAQGLHAVDGTQLHVSAGLGLSGPIPLRVLCPPEITILTVRSAPASTLRMHDQGGVAPDAEPQRKSAVAV